MEEKYIDRNRKTWNEKVAVHVASDFYSHPEFLAGKTSLKKIELDLLESIAQKKVLHLQCHFGQDSLSLSRMGALVTGVDFSDKAIAQAQQDAQSLGLDTRFICSDVLQLDSVLDDQFDWVFTTYGVLGWLEDLDRWAKIISHFLKPGGKLLLVEFHPLIWMYDDNLEHIEYSYFKSEPIITQDSGTYTDPNAPIENHTVNWNHSLGEVFQSLKKAGLSVVDFKEYDYSPYPCFPRMNQDENGNYYITDFGKKIPMVYSILASKSEGTDK